MEDFRKIFTGLERAHGCTYVDKKGADGLKVKGKSFVKTETVTEKTLAPADPEKQPEVQAEQKTEKLEEKKLSVSDVTNAKKDSRELIKFVIFKLYLLNLISNSLLSPSLFLTSLRFKITSVKL